MGLSKEGTLRFKIDWASRIDGSKFSIFAFFLRGIFQVQAPPGGLCYRIGGLIFGGPYTWRGLFSEFYGNLLQ